MGQVVACEDWANSYPVNIGVVAAKNRSSLHYGGQMTKQKNLTVSNDAIVASILAETLVSLAVARVPRASFPINKILWGLSVFLETGKIGTENFNTWHRMSKAASDLKEMHPYKVWKPLTRFEHCKPLNLVYQELLAHRDICVRTALEIIGEYPPIIITKEQDDLLREAGFQSTGDPEVRYSQIELNCDLTSHRSQEYVQAALFAQKYRESEQVS